MTTTISLDELRASDTHDLGTSEWFTVSQDLINQFSQITTDDQWIHVDVERAKQGPFGAPIAHGYLLVSLLSQFMDELLVISDRKLTVNYGLENLRFTGPVPAGSRIRAHMKITRVREKGDGLIAYLDTTIEREGEERPVLVATPLFLFS